jgi:hypothetical protein
MVYRRIGGLLNMNNLLAKIQKYCFSKGSNKSYYCNWDRLGNLIQDIREKIK